MVTKRRQVTGRRDDAWSPEPSFWLSNDGVERVWDGDRLIAGGRPVAEAMWAASRTASWRLWMREPSFMPPAAAATFDGITCGERARESVERFRVEHPLEADKIAVELAAFIALVEDDQAALAALRAAAYGPRDDDDPPAAPELPPDDDDDPGGMWTAPSYDPEPTEPPPAQVVELDPHHRHRRRPT